VMARLVMALPLPVEAAVFPANVLLVTLRTPDDS
jgi:hypothetical protein